MTKRIRCLSGDTQVLTDYGPMPIGLIVDKVMKLRALAYNRKTATFELQPITKRFKCDYDDVMVRVALEGWGSVTVTRQHRFWSPKGPMRADALKVDDVLYMRDVVSREGEPVDIISPVVVNDVAIVVSNRIVPVYNIEVEHLHNYLISTGSLGHIKLLSMNWNGHE
ncbi:MAG: Hint domain-containing protein [Armatimonadia bacterium]